MNKVLAILTNARNLIEEKGWTQHAFARSATGIGVEPEDTKAECFCAVGALRRAKYDLAIDPVQDFIAAYQINDNYREAYRLVLRNMPSFCVYLPSFNDAKGQTKEGVLAVFDAAIAEAGLRA